MDVQVLIPWFVTECMVMFFVGYAMATYGASHRFVVVFSLFTLLLAYCFDPYVFEYHRDDQTWLIVSNAVVVLYFVIGWLFYVPERACRRRAKTSAKHNSVRKNGEQNV